MGLEGTTFVVSEFRDFEAKNKFNFRPNPPKSKVSAKSTEQKDSFEPSN